jgi:hypothetical protein
MKHPEQHDPVDHPSHYTQGPLCDHCGKNIECITITKAMPFVMGNVIKYLWRAGKKGNTIEDLKKARWYLDLQIKIEEEKEGQP